MPIEISSGADALINVASQPANVLLYGAPGMRKTTDAVQAFTRDGRCSAFVIPCEDGALKPIAALGLPVPDHVKTPVKTWTEMQEAIGFLYNLRAKNACPYTAVIIDTLSTFTTYMSKELEEKFAGNKNKFIVWATMRNQLFAMREWIRALGLHIIWIGHAMAPAVIEGVFYPGGPMLSPKTMIEQYYGLIDSVLRVDYLNLPTRPGQPQRVYWTGGTDWPTELGSLSQPPDWRNWRTKNREGCGVAVVPADLNAFLRARKPPYAGL